MYRYFKISIFLETDVVIRNVDKSIGLFEYIDITDMQLFWYIDFIYQICIVGVLILILQTELNYIKFQFSVHTESHLERKIDITVFRKTVLKTVIMNCHQASVNSVNYLESEILRSAIASNSTDS